MTKQESFKRRVRERMAKTGERYVAARRSLLAARNGSGQRHWIAEPEMGDDAVLAATGKDWNAWCDVIDEWEGDRDSHPAVAAHLQNELGVDPWWSQTVTVGYERITGRRLPYQRPDGTFTAGKSKTVTVDGDELRAMLLDEDGRASLFPGEPSELKSKPDAKALRITIGPGVAQFGIEAKGDGRSKVTVAHERLPAFSDVERWKHYWTEWLDAIDQAGS